MSDSPRTDTACQDEPKGQSVNADFARQLERELSAANSRAVEAENVLRECSKALNSSKVWGGMEYKYSPIHPINYNKARDSVNDYWNKRQAEHATLTQLEAK